MNIETVKTQALQLFNHSIDSLPNAIAMLTVLMDQHGLNTTDFKNEIGGKAWSQ